MSGPLERAQWLTRAAFVLGLVGLVVGFSEAGNLPRMAIGACAGLAGLAFACAAWRILRRM